MVELAIDAYAVRNSAFHGEIPSAEVSATLDGLSRLATILPQDELRHIETWKRIIALYPESYRVERTRSARPPSPEAWTVYSDRHAARSLAKILPQDELRHITTWKKIIAFYLESERVAEDERRKQKAQGLSDKSNPDDGEKPSSPKSTRHDQLEEKRKNDDGQLSGPPPKDLCRGSPSPEPPRQDRQIPDSPERTDQSRKTVQRRSGSLDEPTRRLGTDAGNHQTGDQPGRGLFEATGRVARRPDMYLEHSGRGWKCNKPSVHEISCAVDINLIQSRSIPLGAGPKLVE
jgi:hypothetical protein